MWSIGCCWHLIITLLLIKMKNENRTIQIILRISYSVFRIAYSIPHIASYKAKVTIAIKYNMKALMFEYLYTINNIYQCMKLAYPACCNARTKVVFLYHCSIVLLWYLFSNLFTLSVITIEKMSCNTNIQYIMCNMQYGIRNMIWIFPFSFFILICNSLNM